MHSFTAYCHVDIFKIQHLMFNFLLLFLFSQISIQTLASSAADGICFHEDRLMTLQRAKIQEAQEISALSKDVSYLETAFAKSIKVVCEKAKQKVLIRQATWSALPQSITEHLQPVRVSEEETHAPKWSNTSPVELAFDLYMDIQIYRKALNVLEHDLSLVKTLSLDSINLLKEEITSAPRHLAQKAEEKSSIKSILHLAIERLVRSHTMPNYRQVVTILSQMQVC